MRFAQGYSRLRGPSAVAGDEIIGNASGQLLTEPKNCRRRADLEFDITRRKLSHETAQTEIERFSNCSSFRSCPISSRATDRQGSSFDVEMLELCVSIDETYGLSRRHG
jgi:hypothetical protein